MNRRRRKPPRTALDRSKLSVTDSAVQPVIDRSFEGRRSRAADIYSSPNGEEDNDTTYKTCIGGFRTAWPKEGAERQVGHLKGCAEGRVGAIWLALACERCIVLNACTTQRPSSLVKRGETSLPYVSATQVTVSYTHLTLPTKLEV